MPQILEHSCPHEWHTLNPTVSYSITAFKMERSPLESHSPRLYALHSLASVLTSIQFISNWKEVLGDFGHLHRLGAKTTNLSPSRFVLSIWTTSNEHSPSEPQSDHGAPKLPPLFIFLGAGGTEALADMHLALSNSDVSWDWKNTTKPATNWVPVINASSAYKVDTTDWKKRDCSLRSFTNQLLGIKYFPEIILLLWMV